MCVESLSRYLADETGMDVEAIKQLIEVDPDLPDVDFKPLLTKEQAKKLKQALESVKICDPAVGSGAFPLGMMQVMLAVRQAIARREGMTIQRGSLTMSEWKRDIIANNLYGVDIKPEAIEIAKLRMWLSMVVDIPTIDDVEPLPNLDYKLMCGDSLISTINGERLIPDPSKDQQTMLAVTPVQAAIQPVIDLQHQYFTSHADERKVLREKIVEAEKNVFRVAIADRCSFWFGKQQELEDKIKLMKGKVSKAQEKERQQIADKLTELDKFAAEVKRGMRSLNFFQWHLHFNEVFQQKGGFDIVIGNPPYVFARNSKEKGLTAQDKKYLYDNFQLAEYQINLYPLFIEQGHFILHSEGLLSYITPNNWLTVNTNKKLRKFVLEQSDIQIVNFYNQVFDSASVDNAIIIFKKGIKSNQSIKLFEYKDNFKLVKQLQTDYFLSQENYLINIESLKSTSSIDLI
ncbi:MAG: Eco57I restriction-modification methylase domain-containing protein [Nostocaceae cyanobacterium]|nr:Eco57I restriction-modification methylase domain-containing protein [Nostocaceae cyanobacterium]